MKMQDLVALVPSEPGLRAQADSEGRPILDPDPEKFHGFSGSFLFSVK